MEDQDSNDIDSGNIDRYPPRASSHRRKLLTQQIDHQCHEKDYLDHRQTSHPAAFLSTARPRSTSTPTSSPTKKAPKSKQSRNASCNPTGNHSNSATDALSQLYPLMQTTFGQTCMSQNNKTRKSTKQTTTRSNMTQSGMINIFTVTIV